MSLNWNLHTLPCSDYGDPFVPFEISVQPDPVCPTSAEFPYFNTLPIELQLRVFQLCTRATLFQLMRVSSYTRREAFKLFWSYPDAWYCIDGQWLMAGGVTCQASHDPDIQAYIEQVEVGFGVAEYITEDAHGRWYEHGSTSRIRDSLTRSEIEDQIDDFWRNMKRLLPRVVRAVVSERWCFSRNLAKRPPDELKMMLQRCPVGIAAAVSPASFCSKKVPGRALWEWSNLSDGGRNEWRKLASPWTRQSILLPPKDFRGPMGAFELARFKGHRSSGRFFALRFLLLEAREIQRFDRDRGPLYCGPFSCFNAECNAYFAKRGQWTLHAMRTGHDTHLGSKGSIQLHEKIPSLFRQDFERHIVRIELMREWGSEYHRKLAQDWGEEGTDKRYEAEHALIWQLENDPLYRETDPVRSSHSWFLYQEYVEGWPI